MNRKAYMNEQYRSLLEKIKSDIKNAPEAKRQCLQYICDTLKESIEHYDWVGFYLVSEKIPELLELGPFNGAPTDHTEIPFGEGICGQVAQKKKTVVIQDVRQEENYLACSLNVKSEIVVPIIKDEEFIGEIDIDSHKKAPFGKGDKNFLQQIADILVQKNCL